MTERNKSETYVEVNVQRQRETDRQKETYRCSRLLNCPKRIVLCEMAEYIVYVTVFDLF